MRKPAPIRAFPATIAACACASLLFAGSAGAAGSGGVEPGGETSAPTVKGQKAKLTRAGFAVPPAGAPKAVKRAIAAANDIDDAGYCRGGGHKGNCYDCSGAVSYVLGPKGANVLDSPLPSGSFGSWGQRRKGSWITVYYNGGHAFVEVAGLRFDTSIPDDGDQGPGWSSDVKAGFVNGPFKKRHPAGL